MSEKFIAFGTMVELGTNIAHGVLKRNSGNTEWGQVAAKDILSEATGAIACNNQKLTGVADPAAPQDAATQAWVQARINGMIWKPVVKVAAGTNVASLSGEQTVDGESCVDGDRVLLFGQSNKVQNGIWVVKTTAWLRADDLAAGAHAANVSVPISKGTYHDNGYMCTDDAGADVVGTDELNFSPFPGTPVWSTTAAELTDSSGAGGSAATASRGDHAHAHGNRGGGSLHSAVIAGGSNGFMSGSDKTKLDGIAGGATNTPLSDTDPADVTKSSASEGVATEASRRDHKHDISTGTPSSIGTSNAEGSATSLARSDHGHDHGSQSTATHHAAATTSDNGFMSSSDKTKLNGIASGATNTPLSDTDPADVTKSAAAEGVATEAARRDHKHDISTGTPSSVGTANAEGSATSLARSDHGHDHGSQSTATHHAAATTSDNGFMASTDKAKLDKHGATYEGTKQTTDDTADEEVFAFLPTNQKTTMVEANIVGLKSDYSVGAGYKLIATFRRDGDTVTQIGATTAVATHEDAAGWDADIQVKSSETPDQVQVVVTGAAATTINWRCQAVTTVL